MKFIDIECMRSIAFSKACDLKVAPILTVGEKGENKYWSYLYFDLQFENINEIHKAQLILYKIPGKRLNNEIKRRKNKMQRIVVVPTKDYVSPYTYAYGLPQVITPLAKVCITSPKAAYTIIDVTDIVKAWFDLKIENRGMILLNQTPHRYQQYAGVNYGCGEMKPFLHIHYEEKQVIVPSDILDLPVTVRKV